MDAFYKIGKDWEIKKDPDAIVDYAFDWTEWLDDDTITDHTITIEDSETAQADSSEIVDDTKIRVWISGGEVRDRVSVACSITTANGRTDERTFYIRVVER